MTQLKLIAREPTNEMRKAFTSAYDFTNHALTSSPLVAGLEAAWDASPRIETEAEREAKDYVDNPVMQKYAPVAVEIIRALLLERGIK